MTYEERVQIAKTTNNMEELLILAKEVAYNDFKMLMAIAQNSNTNAQIRHLLLEARSRFSEVHEAISKGLLDFDDLEHIVRLLEENTYDWFEEDWQTVKTALITGANMKQLQKEESLSFIFDFKFPGYDENYKYWYIPY